MPLPILKLGDPTLALPATPVTQFGGVLQGIIFDLWETMYAADGLGLAAPQVGISFQIAVVDILAYSSSKSNRVLLINPRILSHSGRQRGEEGCLSVPGISALITRPSRVVVESLDESGQPIQIEGEGLLARVLCHEIDHLNGVLFLKYLSRAKRREAYKQIGQKESGDLDG